MPLPSPVLRVSRTQPEPTSPKPPALSTHGCANKEGPSRPPVPPGIARKFLICPRFCLSSQVLFSFKTKDCIFSIWSLRGQMGHGFGTSTSN